MDEVDIAEEGLRLAGGDRSSPAPDPVALNGLILRSIVDHAIVTLDPEGRVTSWNEGAERILGWQEAEVIGHSADIFFTAEDVEARRPSIEMETALREGCAEDERWHLRRDGTRFWASGLMMPLAPREGDGAGPVEHGFLKVFRDRTEKHLSDRRAADLEARAALALRSSGTIGVWDYDMLDDIVVADEACADLYGVEPATARRGAPKATFFRGVHPGDLDALKAALARCEREGEDLELEYRLAAAAPRPRWVQARGTNRRDGTGRPARLTGIVVDVTEQHERMERQTALLDLGDRLRGLRDVDAIGSAAAELVGRTLAASRAGIGDLHADQDHITIRPAWTAPGVASLGGTLRYGDLGTFAEPLRRGETVVIADAWSDDRVPDPGPLAAIDARSLLNLPLMDGGRLRAVLFVSDARPREWTRPELDFVRTVFDRTFEAIERARADEQRTVLTLELAHRMKNLLAVAQIVTTQTLRHAASLEDGREAVGARLAALSRAQDVLTEAHHIGADIAQVVDATLVPHRPEGDRLSADGPGLLLDPQKVLGLSLTLHELGTNAVKHGAWSTESGRVAIRWSLGADGAFSLRWTEEGGPPVRPPGSRGFGSTILERVAGGYFAGTSTLDFAGEGLVFSIDGTAR